MQSPVRNDEEIALWLGETRTVLVVDDDAAIRRLIRIMLELDGHTVLEAANGTDGIALACAHRPDLAVVDYMMPGLDGERTALEIKELVPSTTVVAFSAGLVSKPYWADLFLPKRDIGDLPDLVSGDLEVTVL
jgi:chemotaxis response regulator CheB